MLSASDVKNLASLKQKKFRQLHKKFLIEGFHLVEECLSSSFNLERIILRNNVDLQKHALILDKISKNKVKVDALPEKSFDKLTETENSQGIVGIVIKPEVNPNNELGNLIIALDRISDPGNLGTIIRTAYWFGVDSVLISNNSADVFNSKVIRASQGGIFHTKIFEDVNLNEKLSGLSQNGYNVYLFAPAAEKKLNDIRLSEKSVLVFGNEAEGISGELLNTGYEKVKIEGYSNCESINAAISCGIALYRFRTLT
ncbi:MAG: RNA methyltransferase [Chlorobi bacterium]|nr:RNA methyltransferase [Chlorobiota bacterium]MCI0715545.1 RNA methyltransferase [Chlorobiota bacterium]